MAQWTSLKCSMKLKGDDSVLLEAADAFGHGSDTLNLSTLKCKVVTTHEQLDKLTSIAKLTALHSLNLFEPYLIDHDSIATIITRKVENPCQNA
jgi:hypothetical protein